MTELIQRNQIRKSDLLSYSLSVFITTVILLLFLFNSKELYHPFVIPVYFTGIIIGLDLIDWLRGRMDVFDPVGFLGIFGYHFFFISPLLQIYWGVGMSYVTQPDDWRTWLFGMALINLIGLLFYRFFRNYFLKKELANKVNKSVWKINSKRLLVISIPALLIMFVLQAYIYISFGGIEGYINTYTSRSGEFEGLGFLFTISESFPIVFVILFFHFIQKSKFKNNLIIYIILFILFFFLKLYFGGLRGSRSNTIWGLIWFIGIFHFFVKPVKKSFIIFGTVLLLIFTFTYGIYKKSGEEGLEIFKSEASIVELADETGSGIDTLLLADLSRARTQAFVLHRLVEHKDSYDYALGRSYIGDVSILIPKKIYPDRPPTKVKEGTELVLGKGNYNPEGYISSRIYGLTGEFMLNFGYLLAPFAFIVLAFFVSKVQSYVYLLHNRDARLYIYPFLVIMCFLILVQDLDNLIFGVIKNLVIPFIILLFIKEKNEKKELNSEIVIR